METRRTGWWPWLAAAAAFVVAALIFEPAWPSNIALISSDSPPYFPVGSKAMVVNNWVNHQIHGLSHDQLLQLLLPPLTYHDFSYIVSASLLALAVAAYLKGRGLSLAATLAGALAMAFAGYHFALFNPGHRGYATMMPYAVFLFALIDRAVLAPRWSQFALMALCASFGIASQPDVMVLFFGIAALYAVLRVVQRLRRTPGPERRRVVVRWLACAGIGAAAMVLASFSVVQRTLTVTLRDRAKQIAQSAGANSASETADPEETKRVAWIFATNWSLPPEGIAEFVVPNLRGYGTNNPHGPYWGRLGQTLDWATHKQGFPNFRQHGLYLGVLQTLLALLAVAGLGTRRSDRAVEGGVVQSAALPEENRAIVGFWLATAVVATLLAMGRYTPLYRLFYALPFMSNLRAPVKFHHLTELAVAILCAFGLAAALRAAPPTPAQRRRMLFVTGLAATAGLACLFAGILLPGSGGELGKRWASMGLGRIEGLLRQRYVTTCMQTAGRFAASALFFGVLALAGSRVRGLIVRACGVVAVLAIAVDMAVTVRPYVNVMDVEAHYARNPIADAVRGGKPPDGMSVAFRLGDMPPRSDHPLLWTFQREGFDFADPPGNSDMDWSVVQSWVHLSPDTRKQWQLWGAKVVLVPPQVLPQLAASQDFASLGTFAFRGSRLVEAPPESAQIGAATIRNWIPPAALYTRWRNVPADAVWPTLADPKLRLDQEVVVEGDEACDPTSEARLIPATLTTSPILTGRRRAVVQVTSDRPGMLLLRERFNGAPTVVATVNGRRRPAVRANGFFWAVPVEAGDNTVVFAPVLAWWRLGLHALTLLLGVWAITREWRAGRAQRTIS